jgi:hypothetical protein
MIDWAWWLSHLAWAFLGSVVGFVLASVLAVSGEISRWGEAQMAQPKLEPEPEPSIDAQLAEAEAKADFYYRMATGQEAT